MSSPAARWDHPRIRGEHLADDLENEIKLRIIPAYAGSTLALPLLLT